MTYFRNSSLNHNNADGGPVRSLNNKNLAFQTTYWSTHTSSMYICPSKLPSQSISVIIQQNHRSNRQGLPDIILVHCALKIARCVTSHRYPGISQSASVFLSRDQPARRGSAISLVVRASSGFYNETCWISPQPWNIVHFIPRVCIQRISGQVWYNAFTHQSHLYSL